jgi:hypothetical protein
VLADEFVSRHHGVVAYRQGRFYLTDDSRNGTVLLLRDERTVYLHRETICLEDQGSLHLGHLDGAPIAFAVELRSGPGGPWTPVASALPEDTAAGDANLFRRDGEYWTLGHAGRILRLKDAKGLRYLACVLRHPQREFPALELVALAGEETPATIVNVGDATHRVSGDDGAGPPVDVQAKREYERRLREHREELEEVERLNDLGRIDAIREEMDMIERQLIEGFGLGSRPQKSASNAERARVAVTQRVKEALQKSLVATRRSRII